MVSISRHRGRISIAAAFTLLALILALVFALSARGITFAAGTGNGHLLQISSDPFTNPDTQHKTQVEPDTFAFGNTVVSDFQSGRIFAGGGASDIGWATSKDGGHTFTHGFMPGTTKLATPPGIYDRISDPTVAYDAKHKVWMAASLAILGTTGAAVLVNRSTNGGTVWTNPVTVHAGSNADFLDKDWIVCDDTASSPHFGNCYVEWDNANFNNLVQMSTSTDGGLTWGTPKTTPDQTCVIGGQPLVQPNGTVIVPIDDCFETTLLAFRSTDGGQTWSRAVLAAQILAAPDPGNIRSGPLPTAEIDQSGKVYVVWEDCRFEPGCNAPGVPNDLVMTTSTDGLNWTLVKRIPIDPVGSSVDHFIPGLAVDRTTAGSSAHLGLAYYYYPTVNCTETGTTACQLNVGFVSSTNGGASWSHTVHVAGPMLLDWLANTTLGRMVGDYISTSIIPGDNDATPVFEVASAPTGGPACDVPPVICHENTFTTSDDFLQIVGGTNTSNGDVVVATVSQHTTAIRHRIN
jgi:hypothetical protein